MTSSVDGASAAPAPKRPNVQMPDEYLPPNKILFLQNLPESVTKDQLMALFSQCVSSLLRNEDNHNLTFHYSRSRTDTPIYTKCVLSRPRKISPSWNSRTREVLVWPRTRCTITSWMAKTKSRCIVTFHSFVVQTIRLLTLAVFYYRSHSPGSRQTLYIIFTFL
jgi:RNA recognition motif-containing protein